MQVSSAQETTPVTDQAAETATKNAEMEKADGMVGNNAAARSPPVP